MALKAPHEFGVFQACLVVVLMNNIVGPGGIGVWGIRNLNCNNVPIGSSTSGSNSCDSNNYGNYSEAKVAVASVETPGQGDGLRFPALVVFGDSTVDAGNNNFLPTVVKSNFEPYGKNFQGGVPTGRFTDGLIAPDFLSQKVGVPFLLPYLSPDAHGEAILTGVNFASSGSGWFEDTDKLYNVKGIATQVTWFQNWKAEVLEIVGPEKGNFIINNALYVISSGSNDWLNDYYINPLLRKRFTTNEYKDMILGLVQKNVQELYSLGGRSFLILSLPPLGCIPEQITLQGHGNQGCVEFLNDIASNFNERLSSLLSDMEKTMPGSRVVVFDVFKPVYDAFQNPQKYGFKYARKGCCGTGELEFSVLCNKNVPTCRDPDEHLFWDSFHPTSHLYSILVDQLYDFIKPIFLARSPNP